MYHRKIHPQPQRQKVNTRYVNGSRGDSLCSARKLVLFSICFTTVMHILFVSNFMKGHGSVRNTKNDLKDIKSHPTSSFIGAGYEDGEKAVTNYSEREVKGSGSAAFMVDSVATSSKVDRDNQPHGGVIFSPNSSTKREEHIEKFKPKATIAYAVSLTSCNAKFIADGAAVLQHSIRLNSFPQHKSSMYAHQMVAFIHPSALECAKPFTSLGYKVMEKEVPINVSEIEGDFLREKVQVSGCCGDKEFLKLYAYTLVEYPIVVHLDLDALILQPLDELFDVMMSEGDRGDENITKANISHEQRQNGVSFSSLQSPIQVMHDAVMPSNIEAFFTKDYNMIQPGHKHPGMQGGFLVIKPNLEYFEEYRRIILKGDFRPGGGWDGKWGGYFGAQQIQGLCSYFFGALHPGTAVELNRCYYNSMSDSPYGKKRGTENEMVCRDGKDSCEDCRETDVKDIKSVHFTLCQKPWICPLGIARKNALCGDFHRKWFEVRQDWENSLGMDPPKESANADDYSLGYCHGWGERNYQKIIVD